MPDRHADRREALRRLLVDEPGEGGVRADAMLVGAGANVRYLTGFTGDSSALIVSADRAVIVSDFRYAQQIEEECPGLEARIRPVEQTLTRAVAEAISLLAPSSIAFEANCLTVADYQAIRDAATGVEFQPAFSRVESLRAIKDDAEVEAIRRSIAAAERAFRAFREASGRS